MQQSAAISGAAFVLMGTAWADDEGNGNNRNACRDLPSHAALRAALKAARALPSGGFNLDMWATVVNRDGVVCAVAFTGTTAATSGRGAG